LEIVKSCRRGTEKTKGEKELSTLARGRGEKVWS